MASPSSNVHQLVNVGGHTQPHRQNATPGSSSRPQGGPPLLTKADRARHKQLKEKRKQGRTPEEQREYVELGPSENEGEGEGELAFPRGAEVRECVDVNTDWFFGAYMGKKGLFPAPYVRVLD